MQLITIIEVTRQGIGGVKRGNSAQFDPRLTESHEPSSRMISSQNSVSVRRRSDRA